MNEGYNALSSVTSGQEFGYEIIPANKKAQQIELDFVNEVQHHFKYSVFPSEGVVTSHTYVKDISDGSNGTFTKDGLDYLWNSQVSSEDATEAEMIQWIEEVMKQSPTS
ncbi:hypothetical protein [Paenibacillus solani]|uniref:hypothetical protein n=1 Tax=Paenibacillus solani TaxID=1705565 RepID=UPI003D2700C9